MKLNIYFSDGKFDAYKNVKNLVFEKGEIKFWHGKGPIRNSFIAEEIDRFDLSKEGEASE